MKLLAKHHHIVTIVVLPEKLGSNDQTLLVALLLDVYKIIMEGRI